LTNVWVLAVSFFNTICLLWLGLMVLLIGNRRSPGVWLTGGGLLLGALFFTSHTAIIGRGLGSVSFGMNFWWWVSWVPAITAPLAWYSALVWYAGVGLRRTHPYSVGHSIGLTATLGLGLLVSALLVFANPLPTYEFVAGRMQVLTPGIAGIPYLVLIYLLYSMLCYLMPLDLLNRALRYAEGSPRLARARRRARPWLSGASLALLLAGGVLTWAVLWALTTRPLPSLSDPPTQQAVLRFDLAVQVLVGLAVILLGRAIVGFEVFTGQAMPRGRFFRHWRSTLLLAGGFGAATAFSLAIELRPIYSLMLATALMVVFYALYSWRSFSEREDFMARLRPFVASQDLFAQMTAVQRAMPDTMAEMAPGQPGGSPATPSSQFRSLCADLLEVRAALLIPTGAQATLVGPGLVYPPGTSLPPGPETAELVAALQAAPGLALDSIQQNVIQQHLPADYDWALPLWSTSGSDRRLSGVLLLAEMTSRAPLTEEEMQIAQAAGERLVDSLAAAEMARLALDLLRQRLTQMRVLEGQGRRVLHDEVLPELHTAILYLSEQAAAEVPGEGEPGQTARSMAQLAGIHRRISDLMRDLPLATPHCLAAGGLAAALPALIEGPPGDAFQHVEWSIHPEAAEAASCLPAFSSEVLFFAARELVRNAARHARGNQASRPLALWIGLALHESRLSLVVEDDGIGITHRACNESTAASAAGDAVPLLPGTGLRMHAALLAAIGATLELSLRPAGGTQGLITIDTV
jgi:signal transduction histidine kinase